jgi:hypothetical protein
MWKSAAATGVRTNKVHVRLRKPLPYGHPSFLDRLDAKVVGRPRRQCSGRSKVEHQAHRSPRGYLVPTA